MKSNQKYVCLIVHTERLHSDKVWNRIKGLLKFFNKFNVQATWFSVNPCFIGYKAMGFKEEKWKERLKVLAENNQSIEQHTHFYKGEKGIPKGRGYDLSPENIIKRIREDKNWLKEQGHEIKGFLSGAWKINEEILKILSKENYKYDLSVNNLNLKQKVFVKKIDELLEIPATANIKRLFLDFICLRFRRRILTYNGTFLFTVHFHDFDLEDSLNHWILLFLIFILSIFNFSFISVKELYERTSKH